MQQIPCKMESEHGQMQQIPCKMQSDHSKMQQMPNAMQNDRFHFQTVANTRQMEPGKKAKKQQNLRQKQTPTILLSVFEHPGYTVWLEGSPFPCRFLVVSQDDPILQGLLSSISDACSLLCRSVTRETEFWMMQSWKLRPYSQCFSDMSMYNYVHIWERCI